MYEYLTDIWRSLFEEAPPNIWLCSGTDPCDHSSQHSHPILTTYPVSFGYQYTNSFPPQLIPGMGRHNFSLSLKDFSSLTLNEVRLCDLLSMLQVHKRAQWLRFSPLSPSHSSCHIDLWSERSFSRSQLPWCVFLEEMNCCLKMPFPLCWL